MMKPWIRQLGAAGVAALLTGAVLAARGVAAESAPGLDPYVQVQQMGRGVNVLSADPLWRDPSKARFTPEHFRIIARGGFQNVRLNLHPWYRLDHDGKLDPKYLATLDGLVKAALDAGLTVILDVHDDRFCADDLVACEAGLTDVWREIGAHYSKAPDKVVFELLNEPNHKLDDEAWNRLLRIELAEVRKTNPTRNVVIGPAFWNNIDHLPMLKLPDNDRHIIATVHYYLPMEFTHQGASWVPQYTQLHDVQWGSDAEFERLARDFDGIDAWSKAHNRPIYLGEFGAYDKGDMRSRARYTYSVARTAESHGFAWSYWQFDSDFIVWDMKQNGWVQPIHDALIPVKDQK
jgi:endoglucanase